MNYHRVITALKGQDHELEDVRRFHEKFLQLNFYEPGFLTRRKLEERARFLQEELNELLDAKTLAKQADALIDLVYVAKGTAVMMGLPWAELWDDVQRANMAKVVGVTHRGNLVDVKKPEGWQPPNGDDILTGAGWAYGQAPWDAFLTASLRDDDVNRFREFKLPDATETVREDGA